MINVTPPREQRALLPEGTDAQYTYTSGSNTSASNEFDWRDYWNTVVKRRRLLLLVFLGLLGTGGYFTLTATSLYTATSVLKIDSQNPTVTGVAVVGINPEGSADYYGTQFALMKSRRLAAKVVAELKLASDESFTKGSIIDSSIKSRIGSFLQYVISLFPSFPTDPPKSKQKPRPTAQTIEAKSYSDEVPDAKAYRWAGRYLGFLKVNPVKGTRLVEVQFTTPDPVLSQLLANAHARGFIAMNMETRQDLNETARQFLDGKNAELKKALEKSEEKLNYFRQAHGVVSMERGENIVVDRLIDLNRKLTEARTQRLDAESLKKTVENRPVQYLSQVITAGLVPSLRASLQALEAERVKLSSTFKPDHPRMLELNQQITETRRSLKAEIANVVTGIDETYGAARAKEQALLAEAQKQQAMALNMKELGVEYAVLEEEVKVNRALYQNVLNRLHSTSFANDLAFSNMQIIQWAERPNLPSSPNTASDIGLSALLGIFLGLGLIFGLEYLDSAVSTTQHVWRAVALNTFGVVPDLSSLKPLLEYNRSPGVGLLSRLTSLRLPSRSDRPGALIVDHHPLSVLTESYRTIRTALLLSQAEKPPQVILLTSASPGEGKTVTTLNLSVALAQDGYKVLVIDADLRNGRCHTRLGLTNRIGLSNILTGDLTLKDGIQETSVTGLSLLSRGDRPPNPSDLLGSNKMRQVLASLRESFNFIVVDSPPAIAVSDAAVLSAHSDAVILVIHAQKTTKAYARQAIERLDAVRAPILGAVLNGINLRNPDYAYYRSYYGSDYGMDGVNGNHSSNGNNMETVAQPEFPAIEISSMESATGVVSSQFFDQVIAKLREAVGPMAPLIVRDQIVHLGESLDAFPKSRLKELFDKVGEEILNKILRQRFETAMIEELRSL